MHTLKPALAQIQYENEKNRNAKVRDVIPVSVDDCDFRCELDDPYIWTVGSHMKLKKERSDARLQDEQLPDERSRDIQLVLALEEDVEDIAAFKVWIDGQNRQVSMIPVQARNVWYFVAPQGNEGTSSAGVQKIHIEYFGNPCRTVLVCIEPSSVDEADYRLMLEDIASMHLKLLIDKNSAGTVSVGTRWRDIADSVDKDLMEMEQILHKLESMPEQDLVAVQARLPVHKVKKINAKTLIDEEMGRPLVRTVVHTGSVDIYEHRAIRGYLKRLKREVELCRDRETRDWEELIGAEIGEDELKEARKELHAQLEPIKSVLSAGIPSRSDRCRRLDLRVSKIPQITDNSSGYAIEYCPASGSRKEQAVWYGYNRPATGNWFNSLYIPGDATLQICFVRYCMGEAMRFLDGSHDIDIVFTVDYVPRDIVINGRTYDVVQVNYVDAIEIWDDDGHSLRHKFATFFEEMRAADRQGRLADLIVEGKWLGTSDEKSDKKEKLFYCASLIKQNVRRNELIKSQDASKAENSHWGKIAKRIDALLTSPILLTGPALTEKLHASNLFTHHPIYRQAYLTMLRRKKELEAIDLWERNPIPVGKTSSIYEIWCLIKMLLIWIDEYAFTLESHTMDQLSHELLTRPESGCVGPIRLEKKSGALEGMVLELEYNRSFRNLDSPGRYLRPDYCLTVSYGEKSCRFFMDAKYYNFAYNQMGIRTWYLSLYDVAYRKYLKALRKTPDADGKVMETSGAYLLHADVKEHHPKPEWDSRRFFWYEADHNLCNPIAAPSLSLGTVCFTPKVDGNFRVLMQMIMEHFLSEEDTRSTYLEKCWICGSEELEVTALQTKGGYRKHHVACKNCGQFWVQTHCLECGRLLGKHRNNYYRNKEGDSTKKMNSWNVRCPDCDESL